MAILYSVAMQSYSNLTNLYKVINDSNIEEYIDCVYEIKNDLKNLKKYIESHYNSVIVQNYNKFESMYYKLLYYSELWASVDWIKMTLDEFNNKNSRLDSYEIPIRHVNKFVESLLSGNNPIKYKNEIARIISGKMAAKTLNDFYKSVKVRTDNFSMINEGFYNPFDDDLLDNDIVIDQPKNITPEDTKLIKKIKLYNNKSKVGGIQFKDNKVYASKTFYMDDIIETAPVRILDDADLYASNVRKLTFPIDLSKRIFGIPFGIGSIARSEIETGIPGNIDYEYDPDKSNEIIIYAIKKINKGDELIFVNDNKMEIEKSFRNNYVHPNEILNISSKVVKI